jgi:8-oxo-dGTP diphosphatase
MELGETVLAAAQRELREECGVPPNHLQWLGPALVTDYIAMPQFHYVIVQVLAQWRGNRDSHVVRAGDDALEARWFDCDEMATADPSQFAGQMQATAQRLRSLLPAYSALAKDA